MNEKLNGVFVFIRQWVSLSHLNVSDVTEDGNDVDSNNVSIGDINESFGSIKRWNRMTIVKGRRK